MVDRSQMTAPSDRIASHLEPRAREDPLAHHQAAKRLDGQPHTEWTYHLHAARASVLYGEAPIFYEPLHTYEDVLRCLQINDALVAAGVEDQLGVLLGVRWYASGFYAPHGVLPSVRADDTFVGRHSVTVLAGSRRRLTFGNSWGEQWGNRNTGVLRRGDFEDYVDEAWLMRRCDVGLSPALYSKLARSATVREVARGWLTPNLPETAAVDIRGALCELAHYRVVSVSTQRVSHVYELRRGTHVVGRAHVALLGEQDVTACIEEIFVPPRHRGRGFGERLEQEASQLAHSLRLAEIRCPTYEADTGTLSMQAATGLAQKAGYSVHGQPSRRPTVVRVATKTLR